MVGSHDVVAWEDRATTKGVAGLGSAVMAFAGCACERVVRPRSLLLALLCSDPLELFLLYVYERRALVIPTLLPVCNDV